MSRFAPAVVAAAALLLSTVALPAVASVLYRCVGVRGETAYVSATRGYRDCVKIGQWPVAAPSPRAKDKPPAATVTPGTPPRAVKANPAVVKVTPLGDGNAVVVHKAPNARAWQPVPVAALDALGSWILPRVLHVEAAPVHPEAPKPAPKTGASSSAAPLHTVAAARPGPAGAGDRQVATDGAVASVPDPKPPRRGAVYRVEQKNGTVLYTNVASLAQGR
ncbi:MAG TPA: hypothetical protein VF292_03230, partial [Rhodanobacteraceae bacterium]